MRVGIAQQEIDSIGGGVITPESRPKGVSVCPEPATRRLARLEEGQRFYGCTVVGAPRLVGDVAPSRRGAEGTPRKRVAEEEFCGLGVGPAC